MPTSVTGYCSADLATEAKQKLQFYLQCIFKKQSVSQPVKLSFEHFLLCQQKFKINTQIKLPSGPGGNVRFKMHFSVSYGKNQNTGTCSDSSDMQPERQTGTKHTHSPTLDKCIKLTSSTASRNLAHRVSREGDLLQVFTQVISVDENIHCHKEGGIGKRQTAYPSELLDATKYPHHSINLLLQPPGPVLHTARDRETERKGKGEKERKRERVRALTLSR